VVGALALDIGEFEKALPPLQECAEISRRLGKRAGRPYGLRNLGWLAAATGDFEAARRHYEESLTINRESGNPKEVTQDLLGLGEVALQTAQLAEAEEWFQQSLALSREASYRMGEVRALIGLGDVVQVGEGMPVQATGAAEAPASAGADGLRGALVCYYDALRMAQDIAAVPWELAAVVGLATVWVKQGQFESPAELLTLAVYHPACNDRTRQRASRLLSRLEAELPAPAVGQAEERGRHAQLEATVARILEHPLPPA
jgi:tetratricopeptide (TPR) repeat protein